MKPTNIFVTTLAILIGIGGVMYVKAPAATAAAAHQITTCFKADATMPATKCVATTLAPVAAQTIGDNTGTTDPATHLPAAAPQAGLTFASVGITNRGDAKLPDDCQDPKVTGLQDMVTYVNNHNDPQSQSYVTNDGAADYVCGWN